MKLWSYIKEKMLANSNQTVCEGKAKMTFEDIAILAETISKQISEYPCCAILCASEMMASISLLGCFAAETTAIPISSRYGDNHCKKVIDTISPAAIITDAGGKLKVLRISDFEYITPEEHPALIMCTSGTTGTPKGVMLSEENILTNVKDICSYFELNQKDSILISRPLYHSAVLTGEFLVSLINGVQINFFSESFNPIKIIDLISTCKITTICGTPTQLGLLSHFAKNAEVCSLRNICISGEHTSPDNAKRIRTSFPGAKIYHVYGLTEACPRVSYLPPELFQEHSCSVGVPLKSVEIKVLKDNGEVTKNNEIGILWVKGNNVMLGYYNSPELTLKVLKDGWLCTGDLAFIDSYGLLHIKGRNDELIIRGGMNIYPQEIETELKKDMRTHEVVAYGYQDKHHGTLIGLRISGDFADVDEVRKLCLARLPLYQVPKIIDLMKELPKNGSGKLIRGNLNERI